MFSKLSNGCEWLILFKAQLTDLVVEEASHHFELHDPVLTQVHVLQEVVVSTLIEPM